MRADYEVEYFVEYVENGVECADIWTQRCLNYEMNAHEVEIIHIELAYDLQKKLGLVDE